jgi:hypothetical protein
MVTRDDLRKLGKVARTKGRRDAQRHLAQSGEYMLPVLEEIAFPKNKEKLAWRLQTLKNKGVILHTPLGEPKPCIVGAYHSHLGMLELGDYTEDGDWVLQDVVVLDPKCPTGITLAEIIDPHPNPFEYNAEDREHYLAGLYESTNLAAKLYRNDNF